MKQTAAAIILYKGKFLIGKAPNQKRWDIPKGQIEAFESPILASIREAREETGIKLSSFQNGMKQLIYAIGPLPYRKDKTIFFNFFQLNEAQFKSDLKCTSFYEVNGKKFPELSEYKWITWDEKEDYLYYSLLNAMKNCNYFRAIIEGDTHEEDN